MARAGGTPQVPGDGVCQGWNRRDAVVSMRVKDYFARGAAAGFACTRKAARNMKCLRTTIWTTPPLHLHPARGGSADPGGGLAVRRAPAEGGGADCLLKPLGYLPFRSYNSALGS